VTRARYSSLRLASMASICKGGKTICVPWKIAYIAKAGGSRKGKRRPIFVPRRVGLGVFNDRTLPNSPRDRYAIIRPHASRSDRFGS
jgi:hypothetical protein